MDITTHDNAAWHAATDKYADALLRWSSGDDTARADLITAYRLLKIVAPSHPTDTTEIVQTTKLLPQPQSILR